MPTPAIIKGSDHFFITTYEGNGTGQKVGRFIPFDDDSATIAKSLIFNRETTGHNDAGSGHKPFLSRQCSATGNQRKYTISFWFKHGTISTPTYASGGAGYQIGQPLWNFGEHPSHVGTYCSQLSIAAEGPSGAGNYSIGLQQTAATSGAHTISKYYGPFKMADASKWYHVVVAVDTTQATDNNKVKIYVDGTLLDDLCTPHYTNYAGGTNYDMAVNLNTSNHYIGRSSTNGHYHFDGYFAEINFVDGTIYDASKFGQTDTSTGRWIPKTIESVTYGTNGYRLQFANGAGQTLGDDTSGNGNDFTVNNIAVTDLSTDSPTQNFATYNRQDPDSSAGYPPLLKEGNLRAKASTNVQYSAAPSSLSWDTSDTTGYYCEHYIQDTGNAVGSNFCNFGVVHTDGRYAGLDASNADNVAAGSVVWYENGNMSLAGAGDGTRVQPGAGTIGAYGNTGDIIMMAAKGDQVWFGSATKGVWYSSVGAGQTGNPATGVGGFTLEKKGRWHFTPALGYNSSSGERGESVANFGQNPSFSGLITAAANTGGGGTWKYTPPTDFKALNQDNLPEEGVTPDIVWIKNRDATDNHQFYDSSRGPHNRLQTNITDGEDAIANGLHKFLKGGFSVSSDVSINTLNESYVSWNWVAGGGTTAANTAGVGATVACTIQKNTTAGISIVEWTGGGSAGTIEHGLGKVPAFMMYKRKSSDGDAWVVYHKDMAASPEDGHLSLQATGSTFSDDATIFNDTAPTTQLATIGTYGMANTEKRVGYFFAEIPGFSKFGKYVGNGSADGPFVNLGFKPKYILFKALNGASWYVFDTERLPINPMTRVMHPDTTAVEGDNLSRGYDFLSNGFKVRQATGYGGNYDGVIHLYWAFAEHPFIGDGVSPATAR